MAEGKGKAGLLLLLLVGGGAAAYAFTKNASAAPSGPASGCRWERRPDGVVNPGDFYAFAFDAPAGWSDVDVATFKQSMRALGFDDTQYAQGAPVPPPYTSPRGVSTQGRYMGTRPYPVPSALAGIAIAVMVLVGCPQPGIAPPPGPAPQPKPGSFPEHSPALPGDHMAAGTDPLPPFPAGVTANDVSDDDPRSYHYPPSMAQLVRLAAQGSVMMPPGISSRMLPPFDPRSFWYQGGGGQPAPQPYQPRVEPVEPVGVTNPVFASAKGFPPRRRSRG